MSFEGFYQCICQNGHYYHRDVYDEHGNACDICEGGAEWWNLVDDTNGESSGYINMEPFELTPGKCRIPTPLEELLGRTYETHEGVFPLATPVEIAQFRMKHPQYTLPLEDVP